MTTKKRPESLANQASQSRKWRLSSNRSGIFGGLIDRSRRLACSWSACSFLSHWEHVNLIRAQLGQLPPQQLFIGSHPLLRCIGRRRVQQGIRLRRPAIALRRPGIRRRRFRIEGMEAARRDVLTEAFRIRQVAEPAHITEELIRPSQSSQSLSGYLAANELWMRPLSADLKQTLADDYRRWCALLVNSIACSDPLSMSSYKVSGGCICRSIFSASTSQEEVRNADLTSY